jgi:hypothetical protein
MMRNADPALSTALHLSVFIHELNGRQPCSLQLVESVCNLQALINGNDEHFALARELMPLLLRYSTKKPFSRRRLLKLVEQGADIDVVRRRLEAAQARRQSVQSSPFDKRSAEELASSIDDAVGHFKDQKTETVQAQY